MTLAAAGAIAAAEPASPLAPRPRHDIPALTGLRGVLALWVVLFHVTAGAELVGTPVYEHLGAALANLMLSGSLAVEGFFILSGFVLSHVHDRDFAMGAHWRESLRFWGLRLGRIYPVHVLMLAAYLIVNAMGFDWMIRTCGNPANRPFACDRFSGEGLAEQLLLIQAWGADPKVGWNFVSWSISSEWFAYICFPILPLAMAPVARRAALAIAGALIAAIIPILLLVAPSFHGLPDDYGLMRVIPTFLAGCLLYRAYRAPDFEEVPWPGVAIVCLGFMVLILAAGVIPIASMMFLPPLVLAISSRQPGVIARALSSRPALWLGRISYALYMSHFLVLELLNGWVLGTGKLWIYETRHSLLGVYAIVIVVTCVVATAIHHTIEQPARHWLRRRLTDDVTR